MQQLVRSQRSSLLAAVLAALVIAPARVLYAQTRSVGLEVYQVSGQEIQGGAWKAGSNPAAADNILDGDPDTYWQPDLDAPLEE